MAQKMLILIILVIIISCWAIRDWLTGPDLRIYLQSPETSSDYWGMVIENPGPKPAEGIEFSWTETSDEGMKTYSRKIDLMLPSETVFQQTSIRNGTIAMELSCCDNFRLSNRVEVGEGRGPPYLILQYNPVVHPVYSLLRFTGFLKPPVD